MTTRGGPQQAGSVHRPVPERPGREPLLSAELDPTDPATQEDRAFLDLFRSVNVGEMIAVVGSGVTVPYGYMSWGSFCEELVRHLRQAGRQGWIEDSGKALFERFLEDTAAPVALNSDEQRALCGALLAHLNGKGKEALKDKYKEWFKRRKRVMLKAGDLSAIFPNTSPEDHPDCFTANTYLSSDLGKLLDLCAAVSGGKLNIKRWRVPETPNELISTPRNIIDPLTTLRSALRISRFATLNYDLEIEAMLEDHDYPYNSLTQTGTDANGANAYHNPVRSRTHLARTNDTPKEDAVRLSQSRSGSSARSISLSIDNASELIGVAVGSRSEDAVIVHLHGAASNPEDMVVTPSDYNALYIHDYPEHDSFEDARMLMFGGNAILYVGVGLSEEDLMRPLRYLASALPDRPIYALVPSLHSKARNRAFVHSVKASYGVNAIIYGRAHDDIPPLWTPGKVKHPIGEKFIALHDELENIRKGMRDMLTDGDFRFEEAFSESRTPRLRHHKQFAMTLKCLRASIEGRARQKQKAFNAMTGEDYIRIVSRVQASLRDDSRADSRRKSIGDKEKWRATLTKEKKLISESIGQSRGDAFALRKLLKPKETPRLHAHPAYQAACKMLDAFSDNLSGPEKELIRFVESLTTSVALEQILSYLPESAAQAQRRWELVADATQKDSRKDTTGGLVALNARSKSSATANKSIDTQTMKTEGAYRDALLGILRDDSRMASIAHFSRGVDSDVFLRQAILLRDSTHIASGDEYDIRTYRISNLVDANMVLPGIRKALKGKKNALAIIYDAARLLDADMRHTRNLSVEYHLTAFVAERVPVLFLTHYQAALPTLSKLFGIEKLIGFASTETSIIAPALNGIVKNGKDEFWALNTIISRYRWPNDALTGVIDAIFRNVSDESECRKKQEFFAVCNRLLESRLRASDSQFSVSIFCDVILQTRHIWVRRYGKERDRLKLIVEHAILKWMFAIHFPIGIGTIQRLVEIRRIKADYGKDCGIRCAPSCDRCADFNAILDDAISDLERCSFIIRVENLHRNVTGTDKPGYENRYILDNHVHSHLAHKRGLTHDSNDRLEWSIATLCNAVYCRGPLLNEDDYISTQYQFEAFLRDYYEEYKHPTTKPAIQQNNYTLLNGLNCAFALLRGHLHAHNAIRAGIAFFTESERRTVLDAHIGRLSRLRSATRSIASGHIPYYEYFEVWVINEIAVAKYIQGDFHDSVMFLRQILFSLRGPSLSGPSISTISGDPTIKTRIKINLCMCLIERAKFRDALALLDEADKELEPIGCAKHHPEGQLLKAMIRGCRAQIQLLTARLEDADTSVAGALELATSPDALGARGWLHGIASMIAQASRRIDDAKLHQSQALAAARGSLRPDLIISLEIAEIELTMRDAAGEPGVALSLLANLKEIEKTAHQLGSHKARVSILLIRARILLYLEQVDSARSLVLDAISLSMLNGMRLKRISGLILMAAIMAMRGEHKSARAFLNTVRLKATRMRYIRAVLDIDRLYREMEIEGGVAKWAGYLSESDVSPLQTPHP
jgi:hypothetical protein